MALVTDNEAPADVPTTNTIADRPVQGALIEAAFVKFAGSSAVALEDPPELDESRVYIVKATCRKTETTLRKDHEERFVVTMEIDSCYERGKVPIVDEQQPGLFEDPAPGESGIDLSGVVDAEVVDDDEDDNVIRPAFSDNEDNGD